MSTFKGPLNVEGAINFISRAAGTGTITTTEIVSSAGVLTSAPSTTEPLKYAVGTGISAGSTQTQGGATALTEEFNNVTTCATDGDGVKLMTAVSGLSIKVKNSGAASLAVYPATSDSINALAVNLAVNIAPGGTMTFNAISATVWETQEVLVLTSPTTQTGELIVKATANDADTVTTLTNAAMGQASVISIPDPGAATANIVLTDAANDGALVTATSVELNYLDIAALGTGAASKAVVLDAGDDYTWPATGILTQGVITGPSMATEKGAGWAGAGAYSSSISKIGRKITTQIYVDIAGLVVSTTLNDVIGDSAAADSHGGQFIASESGTVYTSGSITCLEAPTTGVADIDFNVNSLSTLAESADVGGSGTNVILLANTEAWTLGMTKAMALLPNATSDYLYLSAGAAGTPGTYGAGQFVIELIGYAV